MLATHAVVPMKDNVEELLRGLAGVLWDVLPAAVAGEWPRRGEEGRTRGHPACEVVWSAQLHVGK